MPVAMAVAAVAPTAAMTIGPVKAAARPSRRPRVPRPLVVIARFSQTAPMLTAATVSATPTPIASVAATPTRKMPLASVTHQIEAIADPDMRMRRHRPGKGAEHGGQTGAGTRAGHPILNVEIEPTIAAPLSARRMAAAPPDRATSRCDVIGT